jgi:hypothetical protein
MHRALAQAQVLTPLCASSNQRYNLSRRCSRGSDTMVTVLERPDNGALPKIDRRSTLLLATALAAGLAQVPAAQAIQGLIAGRIPGITGPDAEGYYLYTRPEGKSGTCNMQHLLTHTYLPHHAANNKRAMHRFPFFHAAYAGIAQWTNLCMQVVTEWGGVRFPDTPSECRLGGRKPP